MPGSFHLRCARGMAMAEVMVAIGILAMALFALLHTQVYLLHARNVTKEHQLAVQSCRSRLNEARFQLRQDFDAAVGGAGADSASGVPSLRYEVKVTQPGSPPDLKIVEVTVRWTDREGMQSFKLTSAIHKETP